jgi:hypothetical protein
VEVEIHYDEKYFRLRVRDDGKGIGPEVLRGDGREGHYGLHGMKERAALVGGKLTIWSEVDSGTEIELTIPASRAYGKSTRRFWYFGKRSTTDTDEKETIDRISGSGVFGRDPDTIFNFTRHEEENCYTVESILRNHAPVAPFCVRWDFPLMRVDKELDPTQLKAIGGKSKAGRERQYKAEDWITKLPEGELLSYSELVTLVISATGCGHTTAKDRLIPEAIIGKFVVKVGRKYKRGSGY